MHAAPECSAAALRSIDDVRAVVDPRAACLPTGEARRP
jgi:hypothetical protein